MYCTSMWNTTDAYIKDLKDFESLNMVAGGGAELTATGPLRKLIVPHDQTCLPSPMPIAPLLRKTEPVPGITEVTCTGNQFAEIIQSTILEVEEKTSNISLLSLPPKRMLFFQELFFLRNYFVIIPYDDDDDS
ncbi:hypothetical protein H8959_002866 [Pygathrix nigripes]